jgi:hypothetical protein
VTSKRSYLVSVGVLAMAVLGAWALSGPGDSSAPPAGSATDRQWSVRPSRAGLERELESRPSQAAASVDGAAAQARESSSELEHQRRAVADKLRKQLAALGYGRTAPTKPPASAEPAARMPSPVGSGNQASEAQGKYIQQVVREQFFPVAGSCYEALLARTPHAEGVVVLHLSIVGNDDLGGVVEHVEVLDEGTTLTDADFVTCVRESMYTTTFDAPPAGQNSITVTYPFSFAP